MSLIPEFKIGWCNAWIFWIYFMLPAIIFSLPFMKKRAPGAPDASGSSRREIRFTIISKIIMFFPIIYSIFLPFKLGTLWFYIGLPVALIGAILYTIVWINLATRSPVDKPATSGLYRFSRHPMYISSFIMSVGVGIACASWLFLLLSIISMILTIIFVHYEERLLLDLYSDSYLSYIESTPRWFGIPRTAKD
jgi:protein-S-isoprenylcysteine O-methyltransferase Ste14